MDAARAVSLVTRWLPFLIDSSAPEPGGPGPIISEVTLPPGETDFFVALDAESVITVEQWPIEAVLRNFAYQAAHWHSVATSATPRRPRVTIREMRQWVKSTRFLSQRLPFHASAQEKMLQAAAALERAVDWPERFFVKHPSSRDTQPDAQWRASISLWAMDQLMRAINEIELLSAEMRSHGEPFRYLEIGPTAFWPAMFDRFDEFPEFSDLEMPFSDYLAAQQRITRLDKTVRPGKQDELMISLLREVIHHGYLGPDGQRRSPQQAI
jgi:hypothetical protein